MQPCLQLHAELAAFCLQPSLLKVARHKYGYFQVQAGILNPRVAVSSNKPRPAGYM
jgi:hypothetical protein